VKTSERPISTVLVVVFVDYGLCFNPFEIEKALLSYMFMSCAGSGIPASKNRALELIALAVYREICVQVQPMLWEDVLMDLSSCINLSILAS
jgi:hypothetical protein